MGINNSINANPLRASLGGTGVISPPLHSILTAQGSGAMIPINLTDGQVIVGVSSGQPVAATITQQDGVLITNGSGSIAVTTVPNAKASMPFNFMMMGG